mgnify:CR=1 FL=1
MQMNILFLINISYMNYNECSFLYEDKIMFSKKPIYLKVYANDCKDALLFQSKDTSIKPNDIVMISFHGNEVPAMVVQVSRKIKKTNIKPEFILRKAGFFEKNKLSKDVYNRVKNDELAWIDEIEHWDAME